MEKRVSFLRHNGWVGPTDLTSRLYIIGCGATGSNIALTAAKMGFRKFSLWDLDVVESHNLPNQAYDIEHIGQQKVEALGHVLRRFNPEVDVEVNPNFFTSEHRDSVDGTLVLTTDTMSSRKDIYNVFVENPMIDSVFETRLGFDYGELNIIDNNNILECQNWSRTLCNDEDIPRGPCNLRICTTLVQIVASYTVHMMCAKAAADKAEKVWDYKRKTIFQLDQKITTHNI